MGFFDFLSSFKEGSMSLISYIWVLYIFVPIAIIIFAAYMWKIFHDRKKQWTHTLLFRRELNNGLLSKTITIRMKRFPLIKTASIFQLEKPVLGSYLMLELDSYTGINEFSIIVDKSNRIYINTGETFNPDTSSIVVSAKHAGIDLAFEDLKSDWQNINKVDKKLEWSQIAKFAMLGLLIIAVMVVSIKGIGQWGENHQADAEKAASEAEMMRQFAESMKTNEAMTNAQILILDLIKNGYGTNNIQKILKEKLNETIS